MVEDRCGRPVGYPVLVPRFLAAFRPALIGHTKIEPEWPPHSWRLFSALVAAWAEGAEEELRSTLQWIEEQRAPVVHAAIVRGGAWCRPSCLSTIRRSCRRAREPRISISDPFSSSSLEHWASLVEVAIATDVPAGDIVLRPDDAGEVRLRVAAPGRLKDLTARYARFQRNPSKIHRPSLGETALYGVITDTKPCAGTIMSEGRRGSQEMSGII